MFLRDLPPDIIYYQIGQFTGDRELAILSDLIEEVGTIHQQRLSQLPDQALVDYLGQYNSRRAERVILSRVATNPKLVDMMVDRDIPAVIDLFPKQLTRIGHRAIANWRDRIISRLLLVLTTDQFLDLVTSLWWAELIIDLEGMVDQ